MKKMKVNRVLWPNCFLQSKHLGSFGTVSGFSAQNLLMENRSLEGSEHFVLTYQLATIGLPFSTTETQLFQLIIRADAWHACEETCSF